MAVRQPIRLNDIAIKARTSIATVSLALAGDPRISDDTRRRIRELSQKLGYRPRRTFRTDLTRRGAHEQNRLKFGFLNVQPVEQPVEQLNNAVILQALSRTASAKNMGLEILSLPFDKSPHALVDKAVEFGRRLDGLILMNMITVEQLRQIDQAGVPAVLYGYPMGVADGGDLPIPIVTSDWVGMGRCATEALLACGHTRIGFISGAFVPNMWHERSYDGYTNALLHADLPVDKSLVFAAQPEDPRAGASAAPVFLAMKDRPTAYVAINPGTAGRFVQAMRAGGVEVGPHEIVVCGYEHRMNDFGLDDYPIVYMDPAKIVAAAVMQLRTKCLHQHEGNYIVLVPFSSRNLPEPR